MVEEFKTTSKLSIFHVALITIMFYSIYTWQRHTRVLSLMSFAAYIYRTIEGFRDDHFVWCFIWSLYLLYCYNLRKLLVFFTKHCNIKSELDIQFDLIVFSSVSEVIK